MDEKPSVPQVTLARTQKLHKSIYEDSMNEEIDPPIVLTV